MLHSEAGDTSTVFNDRHQTSYAQLDGGLQIRGLRRQVAAATPASYGMLARLSAPLAIAAEPSYGTQYRLPLRRSMTPWPSLPSA